MTVTYGISLLKTVHIQSFKDSWTSAYAEYAIFNVVILIVSVCAESIFKCTIWCCQHQWINNNTLFNVCSDKILQFIMTVCPQSAKCLWLKVKCQKMSSDNRTDLSLFIYFPCSLSYVIDILSHVTDREPTKNMWTVLGWSSVCRLNSLAFSLLEWSRWCMCMKQGTKPSPAHYCIQWCFSRLDSWCNGLYMDRGCLKIK